MENKPNCNCENKCESATKDVRPEQLYTLTLHDLTDKEIRIKVTESRLISVIYTLSKSFFIEIE